MSVKCKALYYHKTEQCYDAMHMPSLWPLKPNLPLASLEYALFNSVDYETPLAGAKFCGSSFLNDKLTEINPKKDKMLRRIIYQFKRECKNKSDQEIIQILNQTIKNFFGKNNKNLPRQGSEEVLLGDMPRKIQAVCRHHALLTKALTDSIGLKCSVVMGYFTGGSHSWNECLYNDNSKILLDIYNNIIEEWDSENLDILNMFTKPKNLKQMALDFNIIFPKESDTSKKSFYTILKSSMRINSEVSSPAFTPAYN